MPQTIWTRRKTDGPATKGLAGDCPADCAGTRFAGLALARRDGAVAMGAGCGPAGILFIATIIIAWKNGIDRKP